MTGSPSAAQEAGDPSTAPERLLELTEKHPQLQRLIVLNPSCPEVARQWILATNPWAKKAYEQSRPPSQDEADPEPTALHPVVPEAPAEPDAPEDPEDPDAVSAWGDFDYDTVWGGGAAAAPPPAAASSVRISQDAGVVPLGPAGDAAPATAPAPVAGSYDYALAPQDRSPQDEAAAPAAAAPVATEDERSGISRRTWFACGGCLLLALALLLVLGLGGRALLTGDDDEYERDSSTTAQEPPSEEPAEEATEQTPSQDPVSPAPEGAHEMTELRSPTGNISCLLEEDSVSCSLVDRDFDDAGLEDCANGPFSIQVADGEAATACGSSFLSDSAQTLEYDESAVHGDVACTSRFDGMTCWNTITGKGFMANKVTYETF